MARLETQGSEAMAKATSASDKVIALVKSRRFWMAVAGVAAVILHDVLDIPQEQVMEVAGIVIAWIVGDSLRRTE